MVEFGINFKIDAVAFFKANICIHKIPNLNVSEADPASSITHTQIHILSIIVYSTKCGSPVIMTSHDHYNFLQYRLIICTKSFIDNVCR